MGGFCRGVSSDFSNSPAQILPEMGPDIWIPKTLQVEMHRDYLPLFYEQLLKSIHSWL